LEFGGCEDEKNYLRKMLSVPGKNAFHDKDKPINPIAHRKARSEQHFNRIRTEGDTFIQSNS
jgi:hypothetical protein